MKNDKAKILVLEDYKEMRNILVEFLSENGIKVLGAESIKAAINICKENDPDIDLFLIDLRLANGNGLDFLKLIRSGKEPNNSPAIIISTLITENVRKIGGQLGVVAFFEKPFDLYELERVVKKVMKLQYQFIQNYSSVRSSACQKGEETDETHI